MSDPFQEQGPINGPASDLITYAAQLNPRARILEVGCGEGHNAIFLAEQGHIVDALGISAAGIAGAKQRAADRRLDIRFWLEDLAGFTFRRKYDVILSYDVLHMPEKAVRDSFLQLARENTKPGGLHFISVFTNRLPAAPDVRPFTKSLFEVGELPAQYAGWEIVHRAEGIRQEVLSGGEQCERAYECIVARKPSFRRITEHKREYLPLLLLADEEERMIDRYLDRGDLFALYLGEELVGVSVVTQEGDGVLELQNIAITECRHRQGWGAQFVRFLLNYYRGKGKTMLVGTGNVPKAVQFYRYCGFEVSRYEPEYFLRNYDTLMYEDGELLCDKVYLTTELGG